MPTIWTSELGCRRPELRARLIGGAELKMQKDNRGDEMGSLGLGVAFSIVMAIGFFVFIALGTFSPSTLAAPALSTHKISVGLAYGLGLIVASTMTTLAYALQANIALQRLKN
jgi:uncharacterized membrane protein (DUF485 family)